jgi:S-DNA-T family DNA segregation ATPase FtsK/SpoIIIE
MATSGVAAEKPTMRDVARAAMRRSGTMIAGLIVLACVLLIAFALATYKPTDPALNTAAGGAPANLLGPAGAWIADLLLSLFGPPAALLLPLGLIAGIRLWRGISPGRWKRALAIATLGVILFGIALSLLRGGSVPGLPAGWGGAFGLAIGGGLEALIGLIGPDGGRVAARIGAILLFGVGGLAFWMWGLGLEADERQWLLRRFRRDPDAPVIAESKQPRERKALPRAPLQAEDAAAAPPTIHAPEPRRADIRPKRPGQASLPLPDTYRLPPIELLGEPPPGTGPVVDKAALERNARLLETVLEDFHVKGRIVEVRPGPVVTMYELEPASGIKASRVIQLADDIARNMSALSARVATIPGRSVIGIELPNVKRESVVLRELIDSEMFERQSGTLPLVLGKNIAGDPVISDLAPMPHLLVAGTTGSGKSVGLNCMILSLLYRLTPDQCRMIMIDPKMLELSIYDDIPHLLSPVVTEPAKAIRALKWAVEQMEDRYRMMASVGVRSLASFNDTVRAAKAKGKPFTRRVQTGYDAETGQPIYEEETLDFDALPQIVVIVDELADLMMTAARRWSS